MRRPRMGRVRVRLRRGVDRAPLTPKDHGSDSTLGEQPPTSGNGAGAAGSARTRPRSARRIVGLFRLVGLLRAFRAFEESSAGFELVGGGGSVAEGGWGEGSVGASGGEGPGDPVGVGL